MEALGRPRFDGARLLDSRCGDWSPSNLVLDRCKHAKRGVPTLAIVEDLEVLEDRIGELDAGSPTLTVEQLDLHSGPERLDDGVVEAIADGTH